MKLDQAINIEDLHRMAKRKLPKIIFDYIEGGVEDERGLARNEAAFHKHRLLPRYLVDVSKRDQSATVFGRTYSSPFGISPTGGVGLYRREGEVMLAEAAAAENIPYIMSGGSNASMEEAVRVAPNNVWFQLYAAKDAQPLGCADRARPRRRGRRPGADRRRAGASQTRAQLPQRLWPRPQRRGHGGVAAEAVGPAGGDDPSRLGHRLCQARRRAGLGELGAACRPRGEQGELDRARPQPDPGRGADLARSRTLSAAVSAPARRQGDLEPGRCDPRRRDRRRRDHRLEPWRPPARPGAGLARRLAGDQGGGRRQG